MYVTQNMRINKPYTNNNALFTVTKREFVLFGYLFYVGIIRFWNSL